MCLGGEEEMSRRWEGRVQDVSLGGAGRCLGVPGGGGAQKVLGRCPGGVREVPRRC